MNNFEQKCFNFPALISGLGLYIVYFKRHNNITIHMKQYLICINKTFCHVLDKKKLYISITHRNFVILMTRIT